MSKKLIHRLDMERAREVLAEKGEKISREAFSEKYGVTPATYFNYRLGRVPNSILALWRIQCDTGLSLQDLISVSYEEVNNTDDNSNEPNGGADKSNS